MGLATCLRVQDGRKPICAVASADAHDHGRPRPPRRRVHKHRRHPREVRRRMCTTIVVTCTNGELGDLRAASSPDRRTRRQRVVRIRAVSSSAHARSSRSRTGAARVPRLGMSDWDYKAHPDAFAVVAVDIAAARLAELFRALRPDVVISYEDDGLYDHPNHVQAIRVTMAAVHSTKIPNKATSRRSAAAASRGSRGHDRARCRHDGLPRARRGFRKRSEALEARVTTNWTVQIQGRSARRSAIIRARSTKAGSHRCPRKRSRSSSRRELRPYLSTRPALRSPKTPPCRLR